MILNAPENSKTIVKGFLLQMTSREREQRQLTFDSYKAGLWLNKPKPGSREAET